MSNFFSNTCTCQLAGSRTCNMAIARNDCFLVLISLLSSTLSSEVNTHTMRTPSQSPDICSSNVDCSEPTPVCCGKTGYRRCKTATKCIGVPCSSSFECDDGRMWCCSHECKDSACLLPVWAIVLIALAVAVIVSILLIYIILECCRRWPNVRRTLC